MVIQPNLTTSVTFLAVVLSLDCKYKSLSLIPRKKKGCELTTEQALGLRKTLQVMGMRPRRASFISQLPINKIITMCKIVNVLVDNLFLTDEKIFLKDSGDRHTVKRVILNIFSFGQNPNGTIEYNKE